MTEAGDILHISQRDGVTLVRLRASAVRTEAEVEALGRGLLSVAEVPGQRVVLSFLGVKHLTSLVLGQLVQVQKRLAESGGEIRLADIAPQIHEVFTITHLDRLFKIYEREDEALAAFVEDAEA